MNLSTQYLYGHDSQETAYVVNNYPWGFRLRTKIRYWIESKDAKNGGQRFCSQTINPKMGRWCAPKMSTYSPIMVMFLNSESHVKYCSLNMYGSGSEEHEQSIKRFMDIHEGKLTEFQKDQLRIMLAYHEVYKNVKFEVKVSTMGPVSLFSKEPDEVNKRKQMIKEQGERELEREKTQDLISKAVKCEYIKNKTLIV